MKSYHALKSVIYIKRGLTKNIKLINTFLKTQCLINLSWYCEEYISHLLVSLNITAYIVSTSLLTYRISMRKRSVCLPG